MSELNKLTYLRALNDAVTAINSLPGAGTTYDLTRAAAAVYALGNTWRTAPKWSKERVIEVCMSANPTKDYPEQDRLWLHSAATLLKKQKIMWESDRVTVDMWLSKIIMCDPSPHIRELAGMAQHYLREMPHEEW